MSEPVGLARGLTNYGDPDFALYLRRSFARSMGYSTDLLVRPVIGIADGDRAIIDAAFRVAVARSQENV